jgi:hypothetical protein
MDAGTIPPGSLIRAIDQPGAPIDVVVNRDILGFRRQKNKDILLYNALYKIKPIKI